MNDAYGDILGIISDYFYEGWKYRLQSGEQYEVIRKEANEAAHNMLDPFMAAANPRFHNVQATMGWKRICDYCSQPNPEHTIKLSRTPNDETIYSELCNRCVADITAATTKAVQGAARRLE
jgi:hypothetical protein